ncbi:MAG: cytochrome c biogenesis protein CcsA [Campylobacterales bacterium]|nr:cytochrome c biogenesis protein CcsA [Campylobacterales bacterium]
MVFLNRFAKVFYSMEAMGAFILIFAFSIATATFIENDFGTDSAKALVYNAKWFEVLLLLLGANLVGNIFRFRLYRKEKLSLFIFHIAFIIILLGAGITRFFGYEGVLHIREGEAQNKIVSEKTYLNFEVVENKNRYSFEKEVLFSKLTDNNFNYNLKAGSKNLSFEFVEFIPNAVESIVEDKNGVGYIHIMSSSQIDGVKNLQMFENDDYKLNNLTISFNKTANSDINIFKENSKLYIKSKIELKKMSMDMQTTSQIEPNKVYEFEFRQLYSIDNFSFVLRDFLANAKKELTENPAKGASQTNALKVKVNVDGKHEVVTLVGGKAIVSEPKKIELNGLTISLNYGSKYLTIPFDVRLIDFEMQRYPGSNSPSSYSSEVEVIDGEKRFDYKIYMNHILEYQGFRFYQSSFDPDEMGTILSVNKDFLGTFVTYLGYILLSIGMILTLINKNSRFYKLATSMSILAIIFLPNTTLKADSDIATLLTSYDKVHANKFGEILVQDFGGRIKPINTLSHEIVNKVARTDNLFGLHPNQIILGMITRPNEWQQVKMIKVEHPDVKDIVGVNKNDKLLAFSDFFDFNSPQPYKLAQYIDEASRKKPSMQTKFDKEIIKVDEKINICYMLYTGALLKIYPKQNDLTNKWLSPIEAIDVDNKDESDFVKKITTDYFMAIDKALEKKEWNEANIALNEIKKYQEFYGADILPTNMKKNSEILYHEIQIFEKLFPYFLVISIMLLIVGFIKIFKKEINLSKHTKLLTIFVYLGFAMQTIGLLIRWYISGHAPWSDGYESMIYISWATILAGIMLSKESAFTMGATTFLTALILFVSHLSWMDPQITNLVPVLKSYWLTIHVSLITASYGFLALGGLLGFITLILYIFMNSSNMLNVKSTQKELIKINEISLIIGLMMLTIGNFLGGVWANESWGRYWGWDPKETWALVTILVYTFVIHIRFIKSLKDDFYFVVSSVLAISSVIMTYFGVNFYLSGLHSYAKGDPVPVPTFVYATALTVMIVIILAYMQKKHLEHKQA